jgi:hypothetical protein
MLGPADIVSVVGFPFAIQAGATFAVWATGFLASEPAVDYAALPMLLIDCRTRPGQSGSAVIAHRSGLSLHTVQGGAVLLPGTATMFVGIYSGRVNEEADLGMVWKASAVQAIVGSARH